MSERTEECPNCKEPITPGAVVDIGVGMQKCGPDYCETCGWIECDPYNEAK
jgi:RNase P subunit RPR2